VDEFFYALTSIVMDILTEGRRLAIALTAGVILLVSFTLVVVRFASPSLVAPILAGSIGAVVIVVTAWAWWRYLRERKVAAE
jgi:xanthosine utilization system XapX-like protein